MERELVVKSRKRERGRSKKGGKMGIAPKAEGKSQRLQQRRNAMTG